MSTKYLLRDVDVDTDGDSINTDGGGRVLSFWADDFGGGAITVEISADAGNHWTSVTLNGPVLSVTSDLSYALLDTAQGHLIRAKLSGSSGASNVSCTVSN